MGIEKVKVQKDFTVKEIMKKDLPQYRAMGWKEVVTYPTANAMNGRQFNKI